jgi:mono/diheme cytochrome c family protein
VKSCRLSVVAVVALSVAWPGDLNAETKPIAGNAEAGRSFALLACTGCHIVAADQPFKPIYSGSPHPPDFNEIANRSDLTASWLRHHLETLPAVPKSGMPNLSLSSQQLEDIVAFIISLRDKAVAPAR